MINKKFIESETNPLLVRVITALYEEGFVQSYHLFEEKKNQKTGKFIRVFLRYESNLPVLSSIKIISKPSRTVTTNMSQLKYFIEKNAVLFVSTPNGILSSLKCKKMSQGGQLLFICK